MEEMKEDDDDIFGVSGSSESDLSDEDYSTYVATALETYLDNEAVMGPDYKQKSEEEE